MTLDPYKHHARYYETAPMGIIHHSNPIRWMEEARLDILEQIGCGDKAMEDAGIISLINAVTCEYKDMIHSDEQVRRKHVGYGMLAMPQRNITPEASAERLRSLLDVHYQQRID